MAVFRRIGSVVRTVLRYVLPPAIPLALAGVAMVGMAYSVNERSGEFTRANNVYWEARRRTGAEDLEKREELKAALEEYIQGPSYLPASARRRAQYDLFLLLREETDGDPAPLLEAIDGMLGPPPYPGTRAYAEAALALAEWPNLHGRARELVDQGLARARETVDQRREDGRYEDDEDYQRALDGQTADLHDARGWLYLQQGQMEEAELDLRKALDFAPGFPVFLHHMGCFYQARLTEVEATEESDSAQREILRSQAEDHFLRGMLADWSYDWPNPNRAALEALFLEEYGSLESFDEHFAEAIAAHQREKRERVLADRLEEPQPLLPFELENLAGGTFASGSLAGKVAVINWWGTWCVPCVKELPELQLLHEKYRGSEDVVVLTIVARDPTPQHVREWMAERGYDYTVLWNEEYNREAKVRGYPTTWFVDREGNIQYNVLGTTWRLLEEFTWMVEDLLGEEG